MKARCVKDCAFRPCSEVKESEAIDTTCSMSQGITGEQGFGNSAKAHCFSVPSTRICAQSIYRHWPVQCYTMYPNASDKPIFLAFSGASPLSRAPCPCSFRASECSLCFRMSIVIWTGLCSPWILVIQAVELSSASHRSFAPEQHNGLGYLVTIITLEAQVRIHAEYVQV